MGSRAMGVLESGSESGTTCPLPVAKSRHAACRRQTQSLVCTTTSGPLNCGTVLATCSNMHVFFLLLQDAGCSHPDCCVQAQCRGRCVKRERRQQSCHATSCLPVGNVLVTSSKTRQMSLCLPSSRRNEALSFYTLTAPASWNGQGPVSDCRRAV